MSAIWALARTELKSRWLPLLGLAVIVTVATTVLITALVGARRTSTSVERFRDWSFASDATLQSSSVDGATAIQNTVRGLPYVTDSTMRYLINAFPAEADDSTPDFAMYTDPSGRYGVDIDRPRLLRGRMPDPAEPDEIVIDELTAQLLRQDVGGRLALSTWTPEDLEALFNDTSFPGFNGPQLDLAVVGVSRSPSTLEGQVGRATLTALVGPNFLVAHPGVGAWPPVVAVRVVDPTRDLPRLGQEVGAVSGRERQSDLQTAADTYLDSTQQSVGALTTGLWVFALVAGLAAAVAVGQAMTRQISAATTTTDVTRALGLSRRSRTAASALPAALAAAAGVVLGVGLAVAFSPLLPTGLAGRAEIDPGVWVDPPALVVGAALALLAVGGWATVVAWHAQRRVSANHHVDQSSIDHRRPVGGLGCPRTDRDRRSPHVRGLRGPFRSRPLRAGRGHGRRHGHRGRGRHRVERERLGARQRAMGLDVDIVARFLW